MKIFNLSILASLALLLSLASYAQAESLDDVLAERSFHRAKEAVLWSQPVIGVAMNLKAIKANGGDVGDVVFLSKPANWKFRILTPNSQALYVTGVFETSLEDPLVIEVPPRSERSDIFGTIMDSFQLPLVDVGSTGDDKGKGGKYLLVLKGYDGPVPAGYIAVETERKFSYILFRVIPSSFDESDLADAEQVIQGIRSYTLNMPNKQGRHIDVYDRMYNTVPPEDEAYFEVLADFLNRETVIAQDMAMMRMMRSYGYKHGEAFDPSKSTRKMLAKARRESVDDLVLMMRDIGPNLWPGKKGWLMPAKPISWETEFQWKTESYLDTDARAEVYALYCCAPKKLGAASAYILATRDTEGLPLATQKHYRLHVPANVPAKQFWALTAYDAKTAVFFEKGNRTSLSSLDSGMQFNADGSIELYIGPSAPKGKESNWIETNGDNNSVFLFRFYGPTKGLNDGSWMMDGFEKL